MSLHTELQDMAATYRATAAQLDSRDGIARVLRSVAGDLDRVLAAYPSRLPTDVLDHLTRPAPGVRPAVDNRLEAWRA